MRRAQNQKLTQMALFCRFHNIFQISFKKSDLISKKFLLFYFSCVIIFTLWWIAPFAKFKKWRCRPRTFLRKAFLTISYFLWRSTQVGSEPTAAGGGWRKASEWQRSKFGEARASNKFWAPQQDRRGDADSVTFLQDAFLTISYFLWRSTQVVEEAWLEILWSFWNSLLLNPWFIRDFHSSNTT